MFGRKPGIRNQNKRRIKGTPIWYVFIDESGMAQYMDGEPFVLGAIVSDDPDLISSISLDRTYGRGQEAGGNKRKKLRELKYSRANFTTRTEVLESIRESGAMLFSVVQQMDYPGDYPSENEYALYLCLLSRLFNKIAREGPEGFYKIRIDGSSRYDANLIDTLAKAAFDGSGKELTYNGVAAADSELTPAIQTADMFVGAHRAAIMEKRRAKFEEDYGVRSCNRMRDVPPRRAGRIRPKGQSCTAIRPCHSRRVGGRWGSITPATLGADSRAQTYRFPSASDSNIGQHV